MKGLNEGGNVVKYIARLLVAIMLAVSSLGGLQGNVNKAQGKVSYEKETMFYGDGFTIKFKRIQSDVSEE